MNLLAIETSTETMSVGLQKGQMVLTHTAPGGANTSTALIAAIAQLMADADLAYTQLDAIVWGRGPGSFTGVRTACAVAQGLGFAHDLPLLGIDSLAACAQTAAQQRPGHQGDVVAALDARMGELYVARYTSGQWRQASKGVFQLMSPSALQARQGDLLCGNAHLSYPELSERFAGVVCDSLPLASAMLVLAPHLIAAAQAVSAAQAMPLYVRDKVAQTTIERERAKQARTG